MMKRMIGISFVILSMATIVFSGDERGCLTDVDFSRVKSVQIEKDAKYVFNEVEMTIQCHIDNVFQYVVYTPLEKQILGTKHLPGVRGTKGLNGKAVGEPGYFRIVCTDDGHSALEEVIENRKNSYFSYKVWNYTQNAARSIDYAIGEWYFTPEGNDTHIRWRYSFKLKEGSLLGKTGPLGRWIFGCFFLETRYNDFMVDILNTIKNNLNTMSDDN